MSSFGLNNTVLKELFAQYRSGQDAAEESQQALLHYLLSNTNREAERKASVTATKPGDLVSRIFLLAARREHTEILQAFLDIGVSVDTRDDNNSTALIIATCHGLEKLVEWLFERNADVNAQNGFQRTPLIFASMRSNLAIFQLLVNHPNVNLNLQDGDGTSALMYAVTYNKIDYVHLLLQHQADTDLKNNGGQTALDLAIFEESKKLLEEYVNTSYVLK